MRAKIAVNRATPLKYVWRFVFNVMKMVVGYVDGGRGCLAAAINFFRSYFPVVKVGTSFLALTAVGAGYSVLLLGGFWESVAASLLWTVTLTAALLIAWKRVFALMQKGAVTAFIFLSFLYLSHQGIAMPPWQPLLPLAMMMTVASLVYSRTHKRQPY